MRTLVIRESDAPARILHYDGYRLTVFDGPGRTYNTRLHALEFDVDKASAWALIAFLAPAVVELERRRDLIERLADRCRTGWIPVAGEIDRDIRQRTMLRATLAVDLMRYPDDHLAHYSRADVLLGRDDAGFGLSSGKYYG